MRVSGVQVYGLRESIRAAKYPMSTDVLELTEVLTKGIRKLAQSPQGEGHDQWLTGVVVQFDLTFSLKAWTELQRYHFIDFVSSQSTMHRIAKFTLDNQFNDYVDDRVKSVLSEIIGEYLDDPSAENYLRCLYNVPTGFQLTARMTTNYRQLKTMYAQRKKHRLPEWREFCLWVETLPMSYLITGEGDDSEAD